ncbi:hypothetical protein [Streptomyces alanosinicus]|uniref:hypothetical protein n=1 Tax=Streptomyces alanosinicus TaxID=68171 RepID=UPI001673A571|nr:hypothetical protein [Streptomyces alanosinicus]
MIYAEDGKWLASGRAPREGTRLGPEFNDFAGDCMFITRIDNVPGGEGTYFTEWGGGKKTKISEEELRLAPEMKRERFKTKKKQG